MSGVKWLAQDGLSGKDCVWFIRGSLQPGWYLVHSRDSGRVE